MIFKADIAFWEINERHKQRKIFLNHNNTDIIVFTSHLTEDGWECLYTTLGANFDKDLVNSLQTVNEHFGDIMLELERHDLSTDDVQKLLDRVNCL